MTLSTPSPTAGVDDATPARSSAGAGTGASSRSGGSRLAYASQRNRRRPVVHATGGLLLVGLVAGLATVASDKTTVTLRVDGAPRTVTTDGDTVRAVLAAAELPLGPHDRVVPSPTAAVTDGDVVSVRRGRPLELTVDGQERTAWTTATTVGDALRQLQVPVPGATVSADLQARVPRDGLAVQVALPHDGALTVDGRDVAWHSAQPTVAGLLSEAGVGLAPTDEVSVPLVARPTDGLAIRVTRVRVTEEAADFFVAATTVTREDPNRVRGSRTVVQAGQDGVARRYYRITRRDGVETARVGLRDEILRAPVPRIVAVGSAAPAPAAPAPSAPTARRAASAAAPAPARTGGLNWAALARCESGGDPSARSANGLYYGLYQFDLQTWRSVGGSGNPANASPSEQTARAQRLYAERGRSPWPVCGRNL